MFEQLFLEQGLSQSIVQCICQDRTGFLWFGTEDGLNKYDGYKFTVIRNDPDDPNSLSYNNISAIFEDRSGILWISTFYGGLNRYNPYTKRFHRYRHDPDDPHSLSNDNVNTILQDNLGNLWLGTNGGLNLLTTAELGKVGTDNDDSTLKFIRFQHDLINTGTLSHDIVRALHEDSSGVLWIGTDAGLNGLDLRSMDNENPESALSFTHFNHDPKDPYSLSHDEVYSILEDRSGTLWVGTNGGGLNQFDRQRNRFIRFRHDPADPHSLSHDAVYIIFEDSSGMLWIGTNGGGLCVFDRDKEQFHTYINDPFDPSSISYNEIRAIYEDRSGLLWIGTYGGGVDKVDKRRRQFRLYTHDPRNSNGLNNPIVWSIHEDADGILWIGTHGGGLNRFDRSKDEWRHYRHDPRDSQSLSYDIVRVVYEDRSGVIWIGTNGGGLNRYNRKTGKFTRFLHDPNDATSLSLNEIRSVYQDRTGALWIGTYGGGLDKLIPGDPPVFQHYRNDPDDPQSLSNDFVRVTFEDSNGNFWVGTEGGGLDKFDRENNTFIHYRADPSDPYSLNNDYIFSIHEDRSGYLWLSTWGGGINRFDRVSEEFTHYTEKDGLPNDAVYGIMEDAQGNLWLSTNNGLSRFNPTTKTFRNFTVQDGLQNNEFNGGSFFRSNSGEMFFGGITGFNSFYPEDIQDNQFIPSVVITSFSKLNEEVELYKPFSEIEGLTLSHKDYVFSFEFAALDFTAPDKNMYAYRMEGLDEDWVYTNSKKRYATYTTLAPGTYTFRVKGSNSDGVWNDQGTSMKMTIVPPFWKTMWFRLISALILMSLVAMWYRRRSRNIELIAELRTAREAQMSIMPHDDPVVDGFDISGICIPANTVGGDFFDYFWLNEKKTHFGIAVGDVSGKAMESAMTAVMANGMIYSKIQHDDNSVSDMMTSLNRPMFAKTDRKMFTALCLASLDIKKKELTFTNAGLIEPLLKSRNSVRYIEGSGSKHPLGLIEDAAYREKSLPLTSGDVILFLTDGIPEAQNHSRHLYGDQRLKELLQNMDSSNLSAAEIKQKIIDDVVHFTGSASQHDDMTVIVMKVR